MPCTLGDGYRLQLRRRPSRCRDSGWRGERRRSRRRRTHHCRPSWTRRFLRPHGTPAARWVCHGRIEPFQGTSSARMSSPSGWRGAARLGVPVLEGGPGRDIARKVFGEGHPAATQRKRLAGHTNPQAAAGGSPLLLEEQRQGVGCEACHGNAGTWLPLHTSQEWKGYSPEIKAHYGMCAGRRSGGAGRDVRGLPHRRRQERSRKWISAARHES